MLSLQDYWNINGEPQTPARTHDALSRLTSASATGGPANYSESYTYNAATGNLETKGAWTLAYTDPNHPHAVTAAGGNTYAYDANGNQVTRVIGGDSFALLYDAENRLLEVQKNGLTMAAFAYDGDGKRVKSVIGGETILFVGGHYEVVNGSATKYYFAGAQRIALRKNGTLSYLIGDHLGSTSLVTDAAGNKISEIRYKAWGEVRHASGAWVTDYTYTGQYSNVDDFGLMYYGARWYDPDLGRWGQPDQITPDPSNPQDWDRYAYTRSNPIKYIDPDGHFPWLALIGVLIYIATIPGDSGPYEVDPTTAAVGEAGLRMADPVDLAYTGIECLSGNCSSTDILLGALPIVNGAMDNAADAARALDNAGKQAFKSFTHWNFRENLRRLTGSSLDDIVGMEAHHVLPQEFEKQFMDAGIENIHDPRFGSWVDAAAHRGWSYAYNQRWAAFLKDNHTPEEILDFARKLAEEYGFDVYFDNY